MSFTLTRSDQVRSVYTFSFWSGSLDLHLIILIGFTWITLTGSDEVCLIVEVCFPAVMSILFVATAVMPLYLSFSLEIQYNA